MTDLFQRLFIIFFPICLFLSHETQADVVKPALVEISADTRGVVEVRIRASIEALLAGIGSEYKNTQDAPTSEQYDIYRAMQPAELAKEFELFKQGMLERISLRADGVSVSLQIQDVTIPEPGYTKVPRISVIYLTGSLDRDVKTLQWYYPSKFGDNAVRVRQVDETNEKWHWSEWQWLRKDKPSQPFSLQEVFTNQPFHEIVFSYIVVGFEHIVPKGLDHIMFIIGLYLLSVRFKPLLWQVTMFTVAHTITLALSMNGIINLPPEIVEPLIALSIAYVGIENIFSKNLHKSRLVLVFGFGLLHGLGFAGVLADFGMPDGAFATALISFNVGVELGQIAVILTAFLLTGYWFGNRSWYRNYIVIPGSAVISVTGLIWMVDRIVF